MKVVIVNRKKERTAVWLYPDTMEDIDRYMYIANTKTRSEFIEKALQFYFGYLSCQDNTFLPIAISSSIEGLLDRSEDRQSRLLFKLAVEIDMMAHVLASAIELDSTQLNRLRANCVQEVKKSVGNVNLNKIMNEET